MAEQSSVFRFVPGQTVFEAEPDSDSVRQSRQSHLVNANVGPEWALDEVSGPLVGSNYNYHGWLGWYDDGSPIIFSSGSNHFPVGPMTLRKFKPDEGRKAIYGAIVLAPLDSTGLELWFMDPSKDQQPFSANDYRALISKALKSSWTQELVNNLLSVIERQDTYDEQTLDLLERIAVEGSQVVGLVDRSMRGLTGPLTELSGIEDEARIKAAGWVYKKTAAKRDQGLIDLWNANVGREQVVDHLNQSPISERLCKMVRDHQVELIHESPDALPHDLTVGIMAVRLTRSLASLDIERATRFAAEILSVSTQSQMHDEIFHSLSNRLKPGNQEIESSKECQELISGIEPKWLQIGVTSQLFKGTSLSRGTIALKSRSVPFREGRKQIDKGELHWAVRSSVEVLEQAQWPNQSLKTDAAVRCLLTASEMYKRSRAEIAISKKTAPISWPKGLADRIFKHIDREMLSEHQLTLLALKAASNKRPEVIQWFKQNYEPAQLRQLLAPNILKRIENVLLPPSDE